MAVTLLIFDELKTVGSNAHLFSYIEMEHDLTLSVDKTL